MHSYVPCPDIYAQHLLESTEFFLERATRTNKVISEQRPGGHLSPFPSLLLPAATSWQEIPTVSLDSSLPCPLSGLKPLVLGGFLLGFFFFFSASLEELHKPCKLPRKVHSKVPVIPAGHPHPRLPLPQQRQRYLEPSPGLQRKCFQNLS